MTVQLLDELMANAWPPAVTEHLGRWRYRWTHGVSRRANSALAIGGADNLEMHVAKAEEFYWCRDAPPRILVSSESAPEGLVPFLNERGYESSARTLVAHAATSDVIARTTPGSVAVSYCDQPTDDWFHAYWSVESQRGRSEFDANVVRDVLLVPGLPTVFAAATVDGRVVGTGQLVMDQGWGGIQCMATTPTHRRHGVGQAVLHALAAGAAAGGIERMYLAVMANNDSATRLYAAAGFETSHDYSYFTRRIARRESISALFEQ